MMATCQDKVRVGWHRVCDLPTKGAHLNLVCLLLFLLFLRQGLTM
jgi:hypothetical protein